MATNVLTPHITEAAMQAALIEAARLNGWLVYHTFDSRRSDPGWPDLALVRDDVLHLFELKSQRGRVKPEQAAWIAALERVMLVLPAIVRPEPREDGEMSYEQALDLLREGR